MVNNIATLDLVFTSLADATRRDILKRVSRQDLSVTALAEHYQMSIPAVSKHISILERAKFIRKRPQGKRQMVRIIPRSYRLAIDYLSQYERAWQSRFNALDQLLASSLKTYDKTPHHKGHRQ